MGDPGKGFGLVQRESRTCPVCGTNFVATADSGFCPVCILHRAFGAESSAIAEPSSVSGSAASLEETESVSQARRFDQYEVTGRGCERLRKKLSGASRGASTLNAT